MPITPKQIGAARVLLRLDQADVAPRVQVEDVRHPLEEAGVEFTAEGVRRRRQPPEAESLFRDLQAISLKSAAQLAGCTPPSDADLYDEDGLPA